MSRGNMEKEKSRRKEPIISDRTDWAKENLCLPEAVGELLCLKEWQDTRIPARGWLARWGDSALKISGGGVRMREKATPIEAIYLASTMSEKFGISGPEINGSKFVVDFDHTNPRKHEVLKNFFYAFREDLETLGTAGDLNVSETEVGEILQEFGIPNPQWGIVKGLNLSSPEEVISRLNKAMHLPLSPPFSKKHRFFVDVAAGWSTSVSICTYFSRKGRSIKDMTFSIQGVGAVGGSAAWFLEQNGGRIISVADEKGTIDLQDMKFVEVIKNLNQKGWISRNRSEQDNKPNRILSSKADCLVLAAISEVIKQENAGDVKSAYIFEGANRPITPTAEEILYKNGVTIAPDLIVNAGTAELFSIAILNMAPLNEKAILRRIEQITTQAIERTIEISDEKNISLRKAAKIVSRENLWKRFLPSV
jgi:glutamate dehydrogenase (NAD(P)+)